mgnify:CR=1 FL=1
MLNYHISLATNYIWLVTISNSSLCVEDVHLSVSLSIHLRKHLDICLNIHFKLNTHTHIDNTFQMRLCLVNLALCQFSHTIFNGVLLIIICDGQCLLFIVLVYIIFIPVHIEHPLLLIIRHIVITYYSHIFNFWK